MAITLTIANQKGGVGKTTTSVNAAAALSQLGKRVLLVDLDPQGNATMGSGVDKRRLDRSVYHVIIGQSGVNEASQQCEAGGYSLLPANRELAGAEIELVEFDARETRLKKALRAVADAYDFILIDSPPSLSLLTLNGLCAADGVIIPMQCEYYALEGLTDLVNTIRKVHANFNTTIRIIGILRVMFDSRITLSQQVSAQLEEHFKDKVFRSIIPRNIRLAEAPSHGMPGVTFDPYSRGAIGYIDFAAELIERMPAMHPSASQPKAPAAQAATDRNAETRHHAASADPQVSQERSAAANAKDQEQTGLQVPTYERPADEAQAHQAAPGEEEAAATEPRGQHRPVGETTAMAGIRAAGRRSPDGEPAAGEGVNLPAASQGGRMQ